MPGVLNLEDDGRRPQPVLGSPDLTNDTVINCEHLAEPAAAPVDSLARIAISSRVESEALNWHGYLDAFRPDAVKDWRGPTSPNPQSSCKQA